MYKVLIVDDEAIICKGLRNTIEWDSLGLEICGEARNGGDALAMIQELQPNILITDIRMPGMDGITLIQTIRDLCIPIKIIILSGFSDFTFLKEAIRMGVDGYLLKPIDIDELISNLADLVHTIENELLKNSQIYQGMELLRSNTLNRLVTNNIGQREFQEKASFLEISLEGDCCLCAVCVIDRSQESAAESSDETIKTVLQMAVQALWERNGVAFLDGEQRIVALLSGDDPAELHTAIAEAMDSISAQLSEQFSVHLACRQGITVSSVEEIWKSYAAATERFDHQTGIRERESLDGRCNTVVDRALSFIAANYPEAISLKHLAGILEINSSYLGQVFKKTTGESFTNYVNRLRIGKAKELLTTTNQKVYEVAQNVGFTDYHYFLIIFKKLTGINPMDIRS
jgi:two-component system, response regulator YesN